jgi:hypothetical protein
MNGNLDVLEKLAALLWQRNFVAEWKEIAGER